MPSLLSHPPSPPFSLLTCAGGWTNVGIRRDLHILSPTTEGEWGWSQVALWSPRQGPARAAYGPTITACEDADGGIRLLAGRLAVDSVSSHLLL